MKLRLRTTLAIAFVLIATIPVFLFGAWVERSTMAREMAAVSEKHLLLAQNLTRALERFAKDASAVFTYLTDDTGKPVLTPAAVALARHIGFRHLCIVDTRGKITADWPVADSSGGAISPAIIAQLRPVASDRTTFSDVMADGEGRPSLFLSRRLADGNVPLAALDLAYVRNVQKGIAFGRAGHSAIVDAKGNVLAHPKPEWQAAMKNLADVAPVAEMIAGNAGVTTFFAPAKNATMVTGYTTVPSTGWGVMVPQPISELEDRAAQALHLALGIVAIGLVIAGLVGWLLSGYLLGPVLAVARAAKDLSRGQLDARVPAYSGAGPREFRELGQAFNSMADSIATASRVRRFIDEDRVESLRSAQQASRAKTHYLAYMSHELRSPLNSIIGFSDILKGEMFGSLGNHRYKEYAADINYSGNYLLNVVSEILDVSKIEADHMEITEAEFDLVAALRDCVRIVRERADRAGIILVLSAVFTGPPPKFLGDEIRIKQIVLNLVSNAIRYTPSGGTVTIGVRLDDGALIISISDTGIGIPEADLEKVLAPFQQVRNMDGNHQEGTGLGVYLSKHLTELHGGELDIESTVDEGTVVTVRLPASRTVTSVSS